MAKYFVLGEMENPAKISLAKKVFLAANGFSSEYRQELVLNLIFQFGGVERQESHELGKKARTEHRALGENEEYSTAIDIEYLFEFFFLNVKGGGQVGWGEENQDHEFI